MFNLIKSHSKENLNNENFDDNSVHNIAPQHPRNLITISDNDEEEEEEEDTDSESEDSDYDSEDDDVNSQTKSENNNIVIADKEQVVDLGDLNDVENLEENLVETITTEDLPENTNVVEINTVENVEEKNNSEDELEKKSGEDSDKDSLDELSELDEDDLEKSEVTSENNDKESDYEKEYEKLKRFNMATLKTLAEEKGCANYKSLKKDHLINLILKTS